MADLIRVFLQSECGSTAIEYAAIGVIVSVSIVAGATLIGNEVGAIFGDVGSEMANAN